MQLSDTEKKMIARLRRREEQMRRWRWWLLFVGVFCLGAVCYSFTILLRLFHEPDLTAVFVIACFLPQLYLGCLVGAGMIGYTWARWSGNPQTRLLLRLLDEKIDG
ncbi:MAG: hypothetical protein M5U12_30525 [Verrucomicrobia bacterium]|nr:hypothetical protein [Verrucomicrobiales bacterium]MCZ7640008.1 hypothetical protein [Verrucomicrobiota bacterium]